MLLLAADTGRILAVNDAAEAWYGWSRAYLGRFKLDDLRLPTKERPSLFPIAGDLGSGLLVEHHRRRRNRITQAPLSVRLFDLRGEPVALATIHPPSEPATPEPRGMPDRIGALLPAIASLVPVAIMVSRCEDGKIVHGNRYMEEFAGVPRGGLATLSACDFYDDPQDRERILALLNEHGIARNVEMRCRRPGGDHAWALVSAQIVTFENEKAVLCVATDITPRKTLEQNLRAVAGRNTLLEAAAQATTAGIVVTDAQAPDNPVIFVNRAFTALTGYTANRVLGRNLRFLQGPDTDPQAVRTIAESVRQGQPIAIELLNYRADGSPFWMDVRISPVCDETGQTRHWVGILADVSGRRRTAELLEAALAEREALLHERDLLMREANHRIKNSLHLIGMLLDMQRHTLPDPRSKEALSDATDRIVAVARVHERLYHTGHFREVAFHDYLRELCQDLANAAGLQAKGIAWSLAADPCELPVAEAISLGLITNELVANAAKHAFPEGRTGTIRIVFQTEYGRPRLLKVADDGVGLPREPHADTRGLGARLVEALAQNLNGRIVIATSPEGTTVTVVLDPADEA